MRLTSWSKTGTKTAWTMKSRRLLAARKNIEQCSTRHNCRFRFDINKCAQLTQPNPSPCCTMQLSESNASRTKSPRGRSPSGRMYRWPCKDYLQGTWNNSNLWTVASSRMLVLLVRKTDAGLEKKALMHTAKLTNCLAKKVLKRRWQKLSDVAENYKTKEWISYLRLWSSRNLHRYCGRARTHGNQSNVWYSRKPLHVILTFETKIHRLEWVAQVILISVTPILQNLRIGLRKRVASAICQKSSVENGKMNLEIKGDS